MKELFQFCVDEFLKKKIDGKVITDNIARSTAPYYQNKQLVKINQNVYFKVKNGISIKIIKNIMKTKFPNIIFDYIYENDHSNKRFCRRVIYARF